MRETSSRTGIGFGVGSWGEPPYWRSSTGTSTSKRRPSPDRRCSRSRSNVSVRSAMPSKVAAAQPSRSAASLLLLQLPLEDLAGRGPGQFVGEDDVARDLVGGEVRPDEVLELALGHLAARAGHDHRAQPLAEVLVLDAEHRRLGHRLVALEEVLDLAGKDVLPARDDHLVVAAVDEQPALFVEVADIARGHQPVEHVLAAA